MGKLLIYVLHVLFGYGVLVNSFALPVDELSDAQRIMNSLNPMDRGSFVTYHLTLEAELQGRNDIKVVQGFERTLDIKYNQYSLISVPSNFGRNLLNWTEKVMVKGSDNLSAMRVCFPSGCIDPNDVGSNCCPF